MRVGVVQGRNARHTGAIADLLGVVGGSWPDDQGLQVLSSSLGLEGMALSPVPSEGSHNGGKPKSWASDRHASPTPCHGNGSEPQFPNLCSGDNINNLY